MELLNTEYLDLLIEFLLLMILFSRELTKSRNKYLIYATTSVFALIILYIFPSLGALAVIDIFICGLTIVILLTGKWYEKLFSFLLIYILTSLLYQSLALILDLLFGIPIFVGMNSFKEKNIIKLFVIIGLTILLFIKIKSQYYFVLSFTNKVLLCCYTGILCIILTLFHLNQNVINSNFLNMFALLCIFSTGIVILHLIVSSERNLKLETLSNQEKYITILKSYYNEVKQNNIEIRKFRHDIHNHIRILDELIASDNIDKAKTYIQSINSHVIEKTTTIPDVGNALVNAIILQKSIDFPCIKISFNGTIKDTIPIKDYDLCTILSNLLDNALEYSVLNNFTIVNLFMYQDESVLLINIQNYLSQPVNIKQFNRSTKHDSQNHGYGLINVKETLKRYNGVLQYVQDDSCLTTKVQLFLI